MNYKNCSSSLRETFGRTHNKAVSKNFRRSILKWNKPKMETDNKMTVRSSIINMPLKYSFSKIDNKAIQVGHETSEGHLTTEKSEHQVAKIL